MNLKSGIKDFLTISRAKIQLGTPPHPLLGLILGAASLDQLFSFPALIYLILYFLLITFACNINCLYDIDIDKKYKKYMSDAVLRLGRKKVKSLIVVEVFFILFLMYFLLEGGYWTTSGLALSGLVFGYIYSAEPLRVKKRGLFSPVPVLLGLYTLPVLGGWFIFQNSLSVFIIVFTVGYALLNEGITLVNTCEDYQEDLSAGIRTWAHVFNLEKTTLIAFLFTLMGGLTAVIGVILKPFYQGWSFYNLYSGFVFIVLGVVNTIFILRISSSIYQINKKNNLEMACKKTAKKMPFWFILTRYPFVLMAILIFL